jgi:hypothetical protein
MVFRKYHFTKSKLVKCYFLNTHKISRIDEHSYKLFTNIFLCYGISRFTIQFKLGEYRFYFINFHCISQVNQPEQCGN